MSSPFFVPFNFLGLGKDLCSWEQSKIVVLPVPYDLTTSYLSGTRRGPLAILEASAHMELFDDETLHEVASQGIHTLDQLEPVTSGPQDMLEQVQAVVSKILDAGKFPVVIGGEHSITAGAVKALKQRFEAITVVQFDAHADMRNSYQHSPYNHACVGRRIAEMCDLVQIGIRSLSKEEHDFLATSSIRTFFARDLLTDNQWIEQLLALLPRDIYITIDLDVLDPSIMPSVGTPEPGGLGWYDITGVLKILAEQKRIVGFDVVELCPQPANPAPDFLAAKLCYKLLSYVYSN